MKQLIKTVKNILVAAALLAGASFMVAPTVLAAPVDVINDSCTQAGNTNTELCENNSDKLFGADSIFTNIINTIIYVIGAVAVVMIVIGGFRYVVSGGDSGSITSAKNTILYAIVGLVIAVLSYAIVNFVLTRI